MLGSYSAPVCGYCASDGFDTNRMFPISIRLLFTVLFWAPKSCTAAEIIDLRGENLFIILISTSITTAILRPQSGFLIAVTMILIP